jgi:hypothetical protein
MIGLMARQGEATAVMMRHQAMVVGKEEAMAGVMAVVMAGVMEEEEVKEEAIIITRTTKMTIRVEMLEGEEEVAVEEAEVMEVAINPNVEVKGEVEVKKTNILHSPLNMTSHLLVALTKQAILIQLSQPVLNATLILYASSQQSSKLSLLHALVGQIVKTQ